MEISEQHFAATQPINPLPGQPIDGAAAPRVADKRLQQWLYQAPAGQGALLWRLVQLRTVLALCMPTVAGAMLGWWQSGIVDLTRLFLLLSGAFGMVLGIALLNDNRDYGYAQQSNDGKAAPELFATPYHLLAAGQLQAQQVNAIGYGLLTYSALAQLGLFFLVGWPILFFYVVSLFFLYTYAAPPLRYGYRGWGIGEVGVWLGYGIFPLVGSYFIAGGAIRWLPVWVSLPFGLLMVLCFFTQNLVYYRRDWLMRKRTLVVSLGPLRTFDVGALLTVLIYAALLAIASLAHLPLSTLVTLAALPLALGSFSRLRNEQPHLEDVFRLHLTTLNVAIWTGILFCAALLADKAFS